VLLDTKSTVHVFSNRKLLFNIRESDSHITIHCNAGAVHVLQVGEFGGYGTVWYHPHGIANILSFAQLERNGYRVVYNTESGSGFTTPKEHIREFKQAANGLHYLNTTQNKDTNAVALTVVDNTTKHSKRHYMQAMQARQLQQAIGRPSVCQLPHIVDCNLLKNWPVTRQDVMLAEEILRPDLGSLKGKTTGQLSTQVFGE
jgi:hypothetical protein